MNSEKTKDMIENHLSRNSKRSKHSTKPNSRSDRHRSIKHEKCSHRSHRRFDDGHRHHRRSERSEREPRGVPNPDSRSSSRHSYRKSDRHRNRRTERSERKSRSVSSPKSVIHEDKMFRSRSTSRHSYRKSDRHRHRRTERSERKSRRRSPSRHSYRKQSHCHSDRSNSSERSRKYRNYWKTESHNHFAQILNGYPGSGLNSEIDAKAQWHYDMGLRNAYHQSLWPMPVSEHRDYSRQMQNNQYLLTPMVSQCQHPSLVLPNLTSNVYRMPSGMDRRYHGFAAAHQQRESNNLLQEMMIKNETPALLQTFNSNRVDYSAAVERPNTSTDIVSNDCGIAAQSREPANNKDIDTWLQGVNSAAKVNCINEFNDRMTPRTDQLDSNHQIPLITELDSNHQIPLVTPPESKIKNDNPEWHSSFEKLDCKLCTSRLFPSHQRLIKHYVDSHPDDEVIPSRVTSDAAELLRNPKKLHQCERTRLISRHQNIHRQFCYFCQMELSFERTSWIKHMAVHGGYFQYQCTVQPKSYLPTTSHQCTAKCDQMSQQRPFHKHFAGDTVMAYLCDLCNYVRFDGSEMRNHLRNQHSSDMESAFKEVIFLRFPLQGSNDHSIRAKKKSIGQCKTLNSIEANRAVVRIQRLDNKAETPSPMSLVKNNNSEWHSLNPDKICKICGSCKRHAIPHYLKVHPQSEIFPSRLAPHAAESLRSPKYEPKCKLVMINGYRKFHHFCLFCLKTQCASRGDLMDHIATHTGYYKYQCNRCSTKTGSAIEWCNRCSNGKIKYIDRPQFAGLNVISFLCDLCNFIRFDRSEIEKHLRNEHEPNSIIGVGFKEITFLSFSDDCDDKNRTEDTINLEIASENYVDDTTTSSQQLVEEAQTSTVFKTEGKTGSDDQHSSSSTSSEVSFWSDDDNDDDWGRFSSD